ncbi:hypothetical protein ACLKA6_014589 [Drosophila palustris]
MPSPQSNESTVLDGRRSLRLSSRSRKLCHRSEKGGKGGKQEWAATPLAMTCAKVMPSQGYHEIVVQLPDYFSFNFSFS